MRSRHVHDNNRKITHWVKWLQGAIGRISGCPDQNLGIRNWSGISSISDWLVGSWNCRETVAKLPINKICTVPPISSLWKFYSKFYHEALVIPQRKENVEGTFLQTFIIIHVRYHLRRSTWNGVFSMYHDAALVHRHHLAHFSKSCPHQLYLTVCNVNM